MIQRIQSVLLLTASLLNVSLIFIPIWDSSNEAGNGVTLYGMKIQHFGEVTAGQSSSIGLGDNFLLMGQFILILIAAVYLLFVIFQFNDRPKQIKLVYGGMGLLCVQLIVTVLLTQGLGEYVTEVKEGMMDFNVGFFMPLLSILLAWVAAKRINADEELVKSSDRFR